MIQYTYALLISCVPKPFGYVYIYIYPHIYIYILPVFIIMNVGWTTWNPKDNLMTSRVLPRDVYLKNRKPAFPMGPFGWVGMIRLAVCEGRHSPRCATNHWTCWKRTTMKCSTCFFVVPLLHLPDVLKRSCASSCCIRREVVEQVLQPLGFRWSAISTTNQFWHLTVNFGSNRWFKHIQASHGIIPFNPLCPVSRFLCHLYSGSHWQNSKTTLKP